MCSEIFEKRTLRRIYDPIKEYGDQLYNELAVEMSGTTFRMQEQNPCWKSALHKPKDP
jgi:hypothetical protein